MITLYSSHGEAVFDAEGYLLHDNLDPSSYPPGNHPMRLDLDRFKEINPDTDVLARGDIDILCMPYWTKDGTYCRAVWNMNGDDLS